MDNEVEKYLFDILESIEIIQKHLLTTTNFDSFSNNLLLQDAIQRRLAIIGEALWKASKFEASINITDLRKIISFRHILIYDYDKVEMPTIWVVVTKNLIVLQKEIENILKQRNGSAIN